MKRMARIGLWMVVAGVLCAGAALAGQPSSQQTSQEQRADKKQTASPPAQETVAEAARRVRAQKKSGTKMVYTNDNLPKKGMISVVGQDAPPADEEKPVEKPAALLGAKDAAAADAAPQEKGEAYWRGRFAEAREKLAAAQKELDILQREFNLMQMQYGSDPNKVLQEEYNRKQLNDQRVKIDEKKAEVDQLRQAISDLDDELRRAGGDAGWSRSQ